MLTCVYSQGFHYLQFQETLVKMDLFANHSCRGKHGEYYIRLLFSRLYRSEVRKRFLAGNKTLRVASLVAWLPKYS